MQKLQEINFLLGGKLVLVMEVGEGGREGGGGRKVVLVFCQRSEHFSQM